MFTFTIPKTPDLLVNDYTGSSYPTEVHCIEEIIIELHKYEFVQPPVIAESPGFSEQKRPEIQRPRAERQIPAETKPDQPYTESADTKAEPNNAERPNYTEPSKETPSGETQTKIFLKKIEGGIQEAFRPGHEGVQLMKQQLENDTDESNWIANAAIATGLMCLTSPWAW